MPFMELRSLEKCRNNLMKKCSKVKYAIIGISNNEKYGITEGKENTHTCITAHNSNASIDHDRCDP